LYQEIEGERNNNKFGINDTVYLRISTIIKHGDEYNGIIMGMLLLRGTVMSNFSSASSLSSESNHRRKTRKEPWNDK